MVYRKSTGLALGMTLLIGLAACGGSEPENKNPRGPGPNARKPQKQQQPVGMTKEMKRNQLAKQFWALRAERMKKMDKALGDDKDFTLSKAVWKNLGAQEKTARDDFKKTIGQIEVKTRDYLAAEKKLNDFSAASPDDVKKMSAAQKAAREKELKALQADVANLKKEVDSLPTKEEFQKSASESREARRLKVDKVFLEMCQLFLKKANGAEMLRKEFAIASELSQLDNQLPKRVFWARVCDMSKGDGIVVNIRPAPVQRNPNPGGKPQQGAQQQPGKPQQANQPARQPVANAQKPVVKVVPPGKPTIQPTMGFGSGGATRTQKNK
jgi:hypothetical protein